MKLSTILKFLPLAYLCVFPIKGLTQQNDTCPSIVRTAVETAGQVCGQTGRNQACYGNIVLEAEAQDGFANFSFDKPGDVVDVAGVKTIRLSPLDRENNIWGVALMRVQANLPDTLPGQNVTFVLFGNVEIQNPAAKNAQPPTIQIQINTNANVRSKPSRNAGVQASFKASETVIADGRLEDSSWLRVQLADGAVGWVFTDLVTILGDVSSLQVYTVEGEPEAPEYGPMQAFYFSTGLDDAPCDNAPNSGLLVQTPQGSRQISLLVNDAVVRLSSTAYLQAQANGDMTVSVIEGLGQVSASGVTQQVPAGSRVRVPLDANLSASAAPTPPEPYDASTLQSLPIGLLERQITVAPSLTLEEIERATEPIFSRLVPDFYARYACISLEGHRPAWKIDEAPEVYTSVQDLSGCTTNNGAFYVSEEYRLLQSNSDGSITIEFSREPGGKGEGIFNEENIMNVKGSFVEIPASFLIHMDNRVYSFPARTWMPSGDMSPSFDLVPAGNQSIQIMGQPVDAQIYAGGWEANIGNQRIRESWTFYYDSRIGLRLREEYEWTWIECFYGCDPNLIAIPFTLNRSIYELIDTNQPLTQSN